MTRVNELGQPIGHTVVNWTPSRRPTRAPMSGRYCRLEPLNIASHAADLHAANQLDRDGSTWTYLAYGPFASLPEFTSWLEKNCTGDDPMFFAIIDTSSRGDEGRTSNDGRAAGVASYLNIHPDGGTIEVGHIHLAPPLQRTRAATEAMYLMMNQAFELGYRRYEWKCDALNARSRAAAQRYGLSFEGVFRQATVYKGRNRDTAWYAAIDREWPALRRAFETWLDPANFDDHGRQREPLAKLTAAELKKASMGGD